MGRSVDRDRYAWALAAVLAVGIVGIFAGLQVGVPGVARLFIVGAIVAAVVYFALDPDGPTERDG